MPRGTDSTTKFKADITEFKAAMQEAARQVRLANSEFKAATSSMDKWSDSEAGLEAKLKQLNKVLDAQNKQLDVLTEQYEKAVKEQGENSKEAEELAIKINNQKAAIGKTEKELDKYGKELDDCKNETGRFAKEEEKTVKPTEELGEATKEAGKAAKEGSEGFTVMKGALANLVASGIKTAINGLKKLGKAAMDAYKEFDAGADNVIKATGATGEAAKDLLGSYQTVTAQVLGDFETLGSALGEVNTRFGFTGKQLEAATVTFQKFSDITGMDTVSAIQAVSKAMAGAGIDSKDYEKVLDQLATAGQASGISVEQLAESLTTYGSTMRTMGFDTKDTIAMLAQWEKAGVNTQAAITGLRKATQKWTAAGKDSRTELQKALKAIKDAPSSTEAAQKAIETFGTKAGTELAEAIRTGRFEFEDFLSLMDESGGAVKRTYEATQDGFDEIKLQLQGVKADMGAFVRDLLNKNKPQIQSAISGITNAVKGIVKFVIDNLPTILSALKAIATAFVTYKAVQIIGRVKDAISTLATQIKNSQGLLNNFGSGALSPIGLVAAAIGGITAALIEVNDAYQDYLQEEYGVTQAMQDTFDKVDALAGAYRDMDSARQEAMGSVDTEYGHIEELVKEYNDLIDANGNVKKGYEDRANFILTELAKATGQTLEDIQKEIDANGRLGDSINDVIQKKKAEAYLTANESAYMEAIQSHDSARQAYIDAIDAEATARERYNKIHKQAMDIALEYQKRVETQGQELADMWYAEHAEIEKQNELAWAALQEAVGHLETAEDTYVGFETTIKNYEGLSAAIISGDAKKIDGALINMQKSFISAETGTKRTLEQQVADYKKHLEELETAVAKGMPNVTAEMVTQARTLVTKAENELAEFKNKAEQEAKDGIDAFTDGMTGKISQAQLASASVVSAAVQGLKSDKTSITQAGEDFTTGFANGIISQKAMNLINGNAAWITRQAVDVVKRTAQIQSPSKVTQKLGEYFGEGFAEGIGDSIRLVAKEADRLVKTASEELSKKGVFDIAVGNINGVRGDLTAGEGSVSNTTNTQTVIFNQTNNSPRPLDRLAIYRETNSLLFNARVRAV